MNAYLCSTFWTHNISTHILYSHILYSNFNPQLFNKKCPKKQTKQKAMICIYHHLPFVLGAQCHRPQCLLAELGQCPSLTVPILPLSIESLVGIS